MLTAAVGLFAVVVIAGAWMSVIHMDSDGRRLPPTWLAAAHGIAAIAAFAALALAIGHASARGMATGSQSFGLIAAGLFVAAAVIGIYLTVRHVRRGRLPGLVIATHMMLAVTGFVILIAYWSFP